MNNRAIAIATVDATTCLASKGCGYSVFLDHVRSSDILSCCDAASAGRKSFEQSGLFSQFLTQLALLVASLALWANLLNQLVSKTSTTYNFLYCQTHHILCKPPEAMGSAESALSAHEQTIKTCDGTLLPSKCLASLEDCVAVVLVVSMGALRHPSPVSVWGNISAQFFMIAIVANFFCIHRARVFDMQMTNVHFAYRDINHVFWLTDVNVTYFLFLVCVPVPKVRNIHSPGPGQCPKRCIHAANFPSRPGWKDRFFAARLQTHIENVRVESRPKCLFMFISIDFVWLYNPFRHWQVTTWYLLNAWIYEHHEERGWGGQLHKHQRNI